MNRAKDILVMNRVAMAWCSELRIIDLLSLYIFYKLGLVTYAYIIIML